MKTKRIAAGIAAVCLCAVQCIAAGSMSASAAGLTYADVYGDLIYTEGRNMVLPKSCYTNEYEYHERRYALADVNNDGFKDLVVNFGIGGSDESVWGCALYQNGSYEWGETLCDIYVLDDCWVAADGNGLICTWMMLNLDDLEPSLRATRWAPSPTDGSGEQGSICFEKNTGAFHYIGSFNKDAAQKVTDTGEYPQEITSLCGEKIVWHDVADRTPLNEALPQKEEAKPQIKGNARVVAYSSDMFTQFDYLLEGDYPEGWTEQDADFTQPGTYTVSVKADRPMKDINLMTLHLGLRSENNLPIFRFTSDGKTENTVKLPEVLIRSVKIDGKEQALANPGKTVYYGPGQMGDGSVEILSPVGTNLFDSSAVKDWQNVEVTFEVTDMNKLDVSDIPVVTPVEPEQPSVPKITDAVPYDFAGQSTGSGGDSFHVQWAPVDSAEGYEVEETSTSAGMTSEPYVRDIGNKCSWNTGSSMNCGFSVRVRAYRNTDGGKVYSDWSEPVNNYPVEAEYNVNVRVEDKDGKILLPDTLMVGTAAIDVASLRDQIKKVQNQNPKYFEELMATWQENGVMNLKMKQSAPITAYLEGYQPASKQVEITDGKQTVVLVMEKTPADTQNTTTTQSGSSSNTPSSSPNSAAKTGDAGVAGLAVALTAAIGAVYMTKRRKK